MSTKTQKKKTDKKLPKTVGMWKDRWSESESSVDIAREIRKEQWKRS